MQQGKMKMPTSADLMSMWNASGLKSKIIFTVLMIAAFRFGVQMPIFGINNAIFANIASGNNLIGFWEYENVLYKFLCMGKLGYDFLVVLFKAKYKGKKMKVILKAFYNFIFGKSDRKSFRERAKI